MFKKDDMKDDVKEDSNEDDEDEDFEQIDELSRGLLKRYVGRSQTAADRANAKSDSEEDKAMSTNADKYPEKYRRHSDNSNHQYRVLKKRDSGNALARSKLSGESERPSWTYSNAPIKAKVKASKNVKKEDFDIDEETLAASSLHPAAKSISDDKALNSSKVSMLNTMLHMAAGMNKDEMVTWFDKVMAQFGPGKTYGVGDNFSNNQNTLDMNASHAVTSSAPKTKYPMPKLDSKNDPLESGAGTMFKVHKEDLDAMFAGTDLSEEFKESISTIFEAAVNARVTLETVQIEEELEEAYIDMLNEELSSFIEETETKLNAYLDHVANVWLEENAVAIESTLRNELTEEFMDGLKNLFAEHYIDVPQAKVDVLATLADKVKVLESKLDETIEENAELKKAIIETEANDVFEELASDLALTQQEKFKSLAEGIEFDGNIEKYTKKLMIVKENYFKTVKDAPHISNINEEVFEGELSESVINVDPQINRYIKALSRTVKK